MVLRRSDERGGKPFICMMIALRRIESKEKKERERERTT
jgi:hypothetical protein